MLLTKSFYTHTYLSHTILDPNCPQGETRVQMPVEAHQSHRATVPREVRTMRNTKQKEHKRIEKIRENRILIFPEHALEFSL